MQTCFRIYYSKVYWRLNMFRAAYRSSSGALNYICSLWFLHTCGDRPLSRLSEKKLLFVEHNRDVSSEIYDERSSKGGEPKCFSYGICHYSEFILLTSTTTITHLADGMNKFRVCKSVHHHTFNWINQPETATSQVYYLSFRYSSTCFGHPHAHHQELQQLQ